MAVIFAEQTLDGFALDETYGAYVFPVNPAPFTLELGKTYNVIWDDVSYECAAQDLSVMVEGALGLGNLASFGGTGNGEPFVIGWNTGGVTYFSFGEETSHSIAIYSVEESSDDMETVGVSIILYDRTGAAVVYEGVETITTDAPADASYYDETNRLTKEKGATFTYGVAVENAEYELDFSNGDQKATLEKGSLLKEFTMIKPGNLLPEYIKKNVEVAGILGTFAGDEAEKTVELNMADGDQVIEADEDTVLTKVTVTKPETFVPENIAKGIDIGGVVGTFAGASESSDKVTFFDYNGDVVAEYTFAEIQGLEELPEAPEHEGLTFQGWNYTLEEIKDEIAITETILNVGANYITSDGKTRLYVDINHSSMKSVTMYFSQTVAYGVIIDWGDGSATVTRSGTGTGSLAHTYSELGEYVITLEVADGCTFGFGYNSSSYGLFGKTRGSISNILRKVEIGKNVTTIGAYAFYYCYNLETISIPVGITSIGTYAFHSLENGVEYVGIPKGVASIGTYAFYYCFGLKHISIPRGVSSIGQYMFYCCYSLEEAIFPTENAVTGQYVFSECKSLRTIVNAVTYGAYLQALKKIVYKKNDGIIPIKFAHYGYGLEKVSFRDDILGIGANAFERCESLKSIQIPEGVTSISNNAFSYCYSLEEVILPNTVKTLGSGVFNGCYSLKRVVMQEGITSIGASAFTNCASLEEIILPEGLTAIQASTFNSCDSLRKIVIPSTVTDIASPICNYPYSLREVHFLGETPPTFAGALITYGDLSNCTFYVPKGTLETYKAAAYLSTYASQIVEEE